MSKKGNSHRHSQTLSTLTAVESANTENRCSTLEQEFLSLNANIDLNRARQLRTRVDTKKRRKKLTKIEDHGIKVKKIRLLLNSDQVITQDPVVNDTVAYDFEHLFAIPDKVTAPQLSSNKSSSSQKSGSVIWDPFSQHSEQHIQLCTHWANYKEKLDELYWMEVEKSMLRYQPNLNIVDTCKMMSVLDSRGFETIKEKLIQVSQRRQRDSKFISNRAIAPRLDPVQRIQNRLASYKIIEEDTITHAQFEMLLHKESDIERRLCRFTGDFHEFTFADLLAPPEPQKLMCSTHKILQESIQFSKFLNDSKRYKQVNARKISKSIEKYWEMKRTAYQRQLKVEEKRLRKLARIVSLEIKKKWKLVEEIVRARYKLYAAILQKEAGERNLDKMLEHSSRILGAVSEEDSESSALECEENDMCESDEEENESECESSVDHIEAHLDTNLRSWMESFDTDVMNSTNRHSPSNVPVNELEESTLSEANEAIIEEDENIIIPFMLKHTLRGYQYEGMKWLVNLYENERNGILADEMGLGKTIQTIALLAHLACVGKSWGPHLIIVPTSVIINWEYEIKKWCPGFKILTYYGSQKERQKKRDGWSKPHAFNICITSYQIALQDAKMFKPKKWEYLILDEAHNIKNFKSQRWQTLLTFNSRRRLLITGLIIPLFFLCQGTPLQNNLMELWSLLYFLMPTGPTMKEFQEWFSSSVNHAVDVGLSDKKAYMTIQKLHTVLRPYLLRRTKVEVEKQMPAKIEHVVYCRLSTRQRLLYDDFMSRGKTKDAFISGNYLSILNCVMQLRKVCNHPDLFETRPIITSFVMRAISDRVQAFKYRGVLIEESCSRHRYLRHDVVSEIPSHYFANGQFIYDATNDLNGMYPLQNPSMSTDTHFRIKDAYKAIENEKLKNDYIRNSYIHNLQNRNSMSYQASLHKSTIRTLKILKEQSSCLQTTLHSNLHSLIYDMIGNFVFLTPKAILQPVASITPQALQPYTTSEIYNAIAKCQQIFFPDKSLLQYDCGKLQTLHSLFKDLKSNGSRVLLFTQMSKMLDIFEIFLNLHGYRYLRLDGSTKVEQRQILMDRFNKDNRIFVFILSTRSGGVGMNLTGANAVIFYDSDWNPAMDAQAMDRAHRIGQTRDVHIYRLVSEHTIEENMLKKAQKKQALDRLVITQGDFTTDFLKKMDWKDWMTQEASKRGGAVEDALEAVEDVEDIAALKQARKDADEVDFSDDMVSKENNKLEHDSAALSVSSEDGHIEDFMFKWMLEQLNMERLFPLSDFQL